VLHRVIAAAAWASLAVIAYATLSRVGVVYGVYEKLAPMVARPAVGTYVHFEHVLAFAVVGLLFCLAYPRSMIPVCCIVFGAAVLFEVLQTFTPDRHGTLADAVEKMIGGAIGIGFGRMALLIFGPKRAG
jgi:VanZ family protein